MSGGHYDYKQNNISWLANDIEGDFINDGKFKTDDYSVEVEYQSLHSNWSRRPQKEADYFDGATPEQREILLKEVKSLVVDLNKCALRAKHLDWFLSGDTGVESYIECLTKDGLL